MIVSCESWNLHRLGDHLKLPPIVMSFWLAMATIVALLAPSLCLHDPKPLVLVFCPGQPNYGSELARLIDEDGRVDARILVLETEELFEAMIHFPNVKAIIASLAKEEHRDFGKSIDWFFHQGGGVVGLGFAGSYGSTGSAANDTFPLMANDCKAGEYDPKRKAFTLTLIKGEPHEMTQGLSDFTVFAQRIVLSLNITTSSYWPRKPEGGEWRVLYRDSIYGAPAVVAFRENGSSVTFATFGGEDFNRSSAYYGLFTQSEEFGTLFTNAVYWVWTNENRYEECMEKAAALAEDRRISEEDVLKAAEETAGRLKMDRIIQVILTLLLASISSAAILWYGILRSPGP